MPTPFLPYQRDPIAGGLTTPNNWYEFFRSLRQFIVDSGLDSGVIDDILTRLTALEEDSGSFLIQGLVSVSVFGTPESGLVRVELLNDEVSPGNTYYYGTGPTGVKGWATVASAFTNGDGIDLVTGSDGVTNISFNAATAEVASLPGATYDTVQKTIDVMFSPGVITGGEVTELTSTSVRITGGTAIVRIADDNVSELRFFDFASQDFSVPDVQMTHFYALDYNGGSPTIVESIGSESWDRDTEIPLGSAFRADGFLNVTANPYRTGDVVTNLIQRLDAVSPVQRDNSVGGLAIGETGTRNVTVSAGRLWARVSDFLIASKNSSTATMASAYFNGTNVTVTSGITQWDNLNFNNVGAGTLQVLGNNKYANLWFFMSFDGDHYGFAYGTDEYNTIGDAANEGIPPYLTQNFFNQFILLGRFIFQKSAATASVIESAFVTPFTVVAINTHNNLGGLQGGTTGEFYHLTASQNADLTALAALGTGIPTHTGADTWAVTTIGNGLKYVGTTLSAGESGTEDSSTFLRGDGVWSNSLAGPISLGSSSIIPGSGDPEGVVTAAVGSLFLRSDGGAGTTLYVKESGAGNTGWVAK